MKELFNKINTETVNVVFTDYFDTIAHRTVHPNSVLRIWSKRIITELGWTIEIDDLYFSFKAATSHLADKYMVNDNEIPYHSVLEEVFMRLNNSNFACDADRDRFLDLAELIHFQVESEVQFINTTTLNFLRSCKDKEKKIYIVSDFYTSKSIFIKLLDYHGITDLFEDVFVSSELKSSKHQGSIYNKLLSELQINPENVLMIGDNQRSDFKNAKEAGLNAFLLPHQVHLRRNKIRGLGNDQKQLRRVIKKVYKKAHNSEVLPYTEYVIFYYFFVERLYKYCRIHKVKNLFFLAREGQFLKKLFDVYVKANLLDNNSVINTHYLKISRQASIQIALKPIEEEPFSYLRKHYKSTTTREFLSFFNFDEALINQINNTIDFSVDEEIQHFFDTNQFTKLKQNNIFLDAYEQHRLSNSAVFKDYINSFNVDIKSEGIHVIDIGWGGTMQEALYKFFEAKIKVTGLYLGLNEIYKLLPDTKRYGLLFSVSPYTDYNSNILKANRQLYEQFAGANHGTSVQYRKTENGFVVEHYEENEKWLYDHYIGRHQDEMFKQYQALLKTTGHICYNDEMLTTELVNIALRIGLFQSRNKLRFLAVLNTGFYQNLGEKKIGIEYTVPQNLLSLGTFLKIIVKPEEYFKYAVKIKATLFNRNSFLSIFFPGYLLFWYYKINRYIRFKILKPKVLLRFNLFR
ncbi:HAD family hydrolase [Paucihalobacter ruber]|uniref:HAD family hydrolase n=1 Tax=Paucihalobacter ruber TaxID=2567861 RepID=A0A506PHS2_9FLAO|nr:HAD hydrolase-like protein [Paucihalobacter ruber]TPV33361.1 HAD family hydrolase [Paucihalobacter ruber]